MRTRAWLLLALLLPAAPVRSGEGDVRLLTDDAIPRYLARGQLLARNQEWEKVVDVLHRVVIGDKEVFPDLKQEVLHSAVYSEDGRLYYPARELCLKELARLPPEGLRAYRDAYDREARDLFEKTKGVADLEDRLAKYAEVYDKFLPSSVGDDALVLSGDINLALGRLYEALALYRRLIDVYPKDTDRDLPMIFAKAAYCAARIGDREHRDVLLERLASEHPNARIRLEGTQVAGAELKEHPLMKVRGDAGASELKDWPLAGGNPSRSRVGEDLPEDLPRKPLWSFRIEERDSRLHAPYGKWIVAMQDREPTAKPSLPGGDVQRYLSFYPTVRPVVHGGLVIYKDYLEIIARRLGSGALVQLRGRYTRADAGTFDDPKFLHPVRYVRPGAQGNPREAERFEQIYQYFDYGGNSLVIGDGAMVAVESPQAPTEMLSNAPQRGRHNMLVAYTRATGKMAWAWHQDYCAASVRTNEDAFAAWQRDFQNHATPVFQGPGVISGGILYTLAKERDELAGASLWAINIADGRVRFRTPLHYPDEMYKRMPRGAAIAVAGGVVYIVSHSGVVAAVDALPPGRVRWINRYRRHLAKSKANRGRGQRRAVEQKFAYNEPVVSGGKVIVAAADSDEVVALDAETGRLAWAISKRSLDKYSYIVGVADGKVILAGSKVAAIDIARGEPAWKEAPALKAWPYGRGFVGERYVYIPTKHENARRSFVERFDLETGAPARPLEFDVAKLGNLLSVDGRLIAANGREVMCFTTVDAEIDRIDARMATVGERPDLLFERGLIALAADPQLREQARSDFNRALAAAERAKVEDGPIRGHALQNLFALAKEKSDLGALDEAARIVGPVVDQAPAPDFPHHPYQAQIAYLRVELLGQLGRGDDALKALESFIDLHGNERVVRNGKVLDGAVAAGQLRDQMLAKSTAFRVSFEKTVRGRIQTAAARGDKDALRAIPSRYENKPPSEESFFALAKLHERDNEWAEAEHVLRDFVDKFPNHRRRAEAHLRTARLLLRQNKPILARRERFEGISRLDERGRAETAALLKELKRMIETGHARPALPRIRIPLLRRRLKVSSAAPVPVDGKLEGVPAGFVLFANENGYFALDKDGAVLWTQPNPAGGVDPGPDSEPDTVVVAGAIAAARFARARGSDIIVGDVAGLMRIDAISGQVRWRYPEMAENAQDEATQALALLRADLRRLKKQGHLLRRQHIPRYVMAGNIIVRVHPMKGVEAVGTDNGKFAWGDADIRTAPVGPPQVMGELLAVGWSKPGRVRIYGVQDGLRINEFRLGKDGTLFAPPQLDPLGRVIIIGAHEEARLGRVTIVNARGQEPAHKMTYPVPETNAAVLHADGKLIVYHDGSSGTENLHFLDLEKNTRESRRAGDMMRAYELLRDGSRLFVFTHNPGLEDEGARLFRVDLKSSDLLTYDLPLKAHAFARPVLTRRYVAVAASLPRSAHVRLFDREASTDSRGPQPVFAAAGGRETNALDIRPDQETHYRVPPALAVSGEGLVSGHPFGTARLQARDAR